MAKNVSRRAFLKGMAAGAAGAVAAGAMGASLAAAEAKQYTPGTYTATARGCLLYTSFSASSRACSKGP